MHHQWHRARSAGAITGAIGALHHMHHAATKAQVGPAGPEPDSHWRPVYISRPWAIRVSAAGERLCYRRWRVKIPGPGGPLSFRRLKFIAINSADMLCVDPSGGTNWRAGNTVYFAVGEGPLLRITDLPAFDPAAFRAVDSDQVAGPELADDGRFIDGPARTFRKPSGVRRTTAQPLAVACTGPLNASVMRAAEMSVFIASPCRLKREPIAHGADDAVVGAMGSSTAGNGRRLQYLWHV